MYEGGAADERGGEGGPQVVRRRHGHHFPLEALSLDSLEQDVGKVRTKPLCKILVLLDTVDPAYKGHRFKAIPDLWAILWWSQIRPL